MNVIDQKTTLPVHKKKSNDHNNNTAGKKNRFLITINVLGSAGPIRFVVNEEDLVAAVIETALKSYAREGRLPVLGFDVNNFLLYCANGGSDGTYQYWLSLSFSDASIILTSRPTEKTDNILYSFPI